MPVAPPTLAALRAALAPRPPGPDRPPLRLGLPAIDAALPGGGMSRAALHEVAGAGPEVEHAGAATVFVAGLLAGTQGTVLWVGRGRDLFAPALAGVGLHPDRVIHAEADRPATMLLALEDALRHHGLAGVVGELSGPFSLTASRRLQLASEAIGTPVFVLRRSRRHDDPALVQPCAAVTRWRVASLPAPPPLADAPEVPEVPEVPELGRARWKLELVRCRSGEPQTWIVEACDAQGRLGVPAEFSHRPAARPPRPTRQHSARHHAA